MIISCSCRRIAGFFLLAEKPESVATLGRIILAMFTKEQLEKITFVYGEPSLIPSRLRLRSKGVAFKPFSRLWLVNNVRRGHRSPSGPHLL